MRFDAIDGDTKLHRKRVSVLGNSAAQSDYPCVVDKSNIRLCFGNEKGELIDQPEMYRYALHVPFGGRNAPTVKRCTVTVVLLNPSCCTKDKCDQTTKRALKYVLVNSRMFGDVDKVITVNLYAWHETSSEKLANLLVDYSPEYVVGPHNDRYIKDAVAQSTAIIAAWGGPPRQLKNVISTYCRRIRHVWDLLDGKPIFCAGTTRQGFPRHFARGKLECPQPYDISRCPLVYTW